MAFLFALNGKLGIQFAIEAIKASISAWDNTRPGLEAAGAAAGAGAGVTCVAQKAAPPPTCGDLPIILASSACCSASSPFESMLTPFRYNFNCQSPLFYKNHPNKSTNP